MRLFSGKTEIQINESYKKIPRLKVPKFNNKKCFRLNLLGCLAMNIRVHYDLNDKHIRLNEIEVYGMKKSRFSQVLVSININSSIYDGKQSVRITVNISYNSIFKNEVGSCIIKLTQQGSLIESAKTDNISVEQPVDDGCDPRISR